MLHFHSEKHQQSCIINQAGLALRSPSSPVCFIYIQTPLVYALIVCQAYRSIFLNQCKFDFLHLYDLLVAQKSLQTGKWSASCVQSCEETDHNVQFYWIISVVITSVILIMVRHSLQFILSIYHDCRKQIFRSLIVENRFSGVLECCTSCYTPSIPSSCGRLRC